MAYRIGRPGDGANAGSFVLADGGERMSWGAIIAGVFAALAVQIFLLITGVAAGLVVTDAVDEAAPFFLGFTGLASLFCGGFVAGRMAGVPLMPTAALHGALVWSFVIVLSVVLAAGGAASIVGGVARVAGGVGQTAAQAAGGVANMLPDDVSTIVPEEIEQQLSDAIGDEQLSARQLRQEARDIFTSVIGEDERNRAAEIIRQTARRVLEDPANADAALASALDRLAGAGGVVGPEEHDELIGELSQRFDLSEDEATTIVERWTATIEEAATQSRAMLEEARVELARLADEASEAAAAAAASTALVLFIGLFGACAGALVGRPEDLLAVEVAEAREESR